MDRRTALKYGVSGLGLLAGCSSKPNPSATTTSTQPTTTSNPTSTEGFRQLEHFVGTNGPNFYLDEEPFFFNGANNDMLVRAPKWYVDRVFEAAAELDLNVLRTWPYGGTCWVGECKGENLLLYPEPGKYNETTFENLDYLIAKANEYDIRLVLPFINNYEGHLGIPDFIEWSETATKRDEFFTDPNCKDLYKEYLTDLLTRTNTYTGREYRDDPGILMWELVNEPDLKDNDGPTEIIQNWIEEMGEFVKSIDGNHLLTTGEIGFYDASRRKTDDRDRLYLGPQGTDYIRDHRPPEIDAAGFHFHFEGLGITLEEAKQWIRDHAVDAHEVLEKPVYIGEFSPSGDGRYIVDRRDENWKEQDRELSEVYDDLYSTFLEYRVNGAIQWSFMIPFDHNTDSVDDPSEWNGPGIVYADDPYTPEVIRKYSEELTSLAERQSTRSTSEVTEPTTQH